MKKSRLLGLIYTVTLSIVSMPVIAAAVSGQGTRETTLYQRDLDGDLTTAEAYYDTLLDITWLADVNVNGFIACQSVDLRSILNRVCFGT